MAQHSAHTHTHCTMASRFEVGNKVCRKTHRGTVGVVREVSEDGSKVVVQWGEELISRKRWTNCDGLDLADRQPLPVWLRRAQQAKSEPGETPDSGDVHLVLDNDKDGVLWAAFDAGEESQAKASSMLGSLGLRLSDVNLPTCKWKQRKATPRQSSSTSSEKKYGRQCTRAHVYTYR